MLYFVMARSAKRDEVRWRIVFTLNPRDNVMDCKFLLGFTDHAFMPIAIENGGANIPSPIRLSDSAIARADRMPDVVCANTGAVFTIVSYPVLEGLFASQADRGNALNRSI